MGMKLFTKIIKTCSGDCPNYKFKDFECGGMTADWCLLSDRFIKPNDVGKIPSWCELEEFGDPVSKVFACSKM